MNDSQDAEEDYARTAACRTPRVVYVTSENTRTYANLLPSNRGRSSIVHSLIDSLGLLESESDADEEKNEDVSRPEDLSRARVIEPLQMSRSDLCRFHDKEYVSGLSS